MDRSEDQGRGTPEPHRATGEWTLDPDIVADRIGGEIVLVHLRTNKIFELNATATRIFELMRGGADRVELLATLRREYSIEPERLAASFEKLLGELRTAGILR